MCCHKLIIIKQEVTHLSALPSASVQLSLLCAVTCEHLRAEEHKELPRVIITLIRLALHLSTSPQRPACEPFYWVLKVARVGTCQNCVSGKLALDEPDLVENTHSMCVCVCVCVQSMQADVLAQLGPLPSHHRVSFVPISCTFC